MPLEDDKAFNQFPKNFRSNMGVLRAILAHLEPPVVWSVQKLELRLAPVYRSHVFRCTHISFGLTAAYFSTVPG